MPNRYSNFKIAWFPDKLNSLKNDIVTAPIWIRIKPTNRCCHNCYFCVYNSSFSNMHETANRTDEIPINKMIEIIQDIKSIGVMGVTYSCGGSPLVHKNIKDILKETLDQQLELSMLTNGQKITKDIVPYLIQAKWVRISMDYFSEESFIRSRRVKKEMYNELCSNIKNFTAANKTCEIGANYIITKENYNNIEDSIKLIISLGIKNVRYSPVWVQNFYTYHSEIQEKVISSLNKIRSRYSDKIDIYHSYKITDTVASRTYNKCYFQQIVPVIGADLNIYNCHNKAYTKDGLIGSIKNKKFSELWFMYKTYRHFNDFNPLLKCNHQCANDTKNLFIKELLNCTDDNCV